MAAKEKGQAPPEAPKGVQERAYVVAPGLSVIGVYGVIDAGTPVVPADFNGGRPTFDDAIARGLLVVAPSAPETPAPES